MDTSSSSSDTGVSQMTFVPKKEGEQKKINRLFSRKPNAPAATTSAPPPDVPPPVASPKRKAEAPAPASPPATKKTKVKVEPTPEKPKTKLIDMSDDDPPAPTVKKEPKVKAEDPEETDDDESKQEEKKKPKVKKEEEEKTPQKKKKKSRTISDDDEPEQGELEQLANEEKAALEMLAAIEAKRAKAKAEKDGVIAAVAEKTVKRQKDKKNAEEAKSKKKKKHRTKKGLIDDEVDDGTDDDNGDENMSAKEKRRELREQRAFLAPEDDGRVINPAAIEEDASGSEDEESDAEMEGTESDAEAEELANHIKERADKMVAEKPKKAKKGSKGKSKEGEKKKKTSKGHPCIVCFDNIAEGWQQARSSGKKKQWLFFHPTKCWPQYMADPTKDWSKPAEDKKAAEAKKEKEAAAAKEKAKKAKAEAAAAAEKAAAEAKKSKPAGATNGKKAGVLGENAKGGENKRPLPRAITKAELTERLKTAKGKWHECMESSYKQIIAETDKKITDTYAASLTALCRDIEAVEAWREACDKCKSPADHPEAPELFSTKDYGTAAMLYYGISCTAGWGLMNDLIDKAYV